MTGFKAKLLKPIAAAAVLVMASNANAASPSEDDFLACLSLVAKAQSMMSEVEEYSEYASRLWGYEPVKIADTLEKYRFEASFGLLLHRYENNRIDGNKATSVAFTEVADSSRKANVDYTAQLIASARSAADPLAETKALVQAQLGREIWKCEGAVRKLRYKIEAYAPLKAEMEARMQAARQEFEQSSPISILR
ncbi:hypothetical protein [uncultured Roseibium sp.]|uniref:hypothetical protein n=1 Tax=uncultured Roseibium sp. TaxID=1936171 RepID=UPI0026094CE5|nr:hypothetical protein [uncultured Roseibium sp.]